MLKNITVGHTVSKATRAPVKNSAEMLALLALGTKKRRIRETKMNNVSSRSHAILKIYLGVKQEGNNIMESVINLVDLAGTESAKKTGNTGLEAHAEMSNINRSLLAFKQIITSMAKNDQIIARGTVLVKMLQGNYRLIRIFNYMKYFVTKISVRWKLLFNQYFMCLQTR